MIDTQKKIDFKTNRYIWDWYSGTSKCHSVYGFVDMLGMSSIPWQTVKGMHGYKDRICFDGVNIHYNGREDMGVWLEMSGTGCRAFETYGNGDWENLCEEFVYESKDMNLTRIDIAFDDCERLLNMDRLMMDTIEKDEDAYEETGETVPIRFISRFGEFGAYITSKGRSIEHGEKRSEAMLRIYDKAAQMKIRGHWIRVELQLRRDRAAVFARKFVQGKQTLPEFYLGIVKNYLRYVEPQAGDSNKWRWPMADYWSRFLAGAEKISVYEKPGVEYNMMNLEDYVIKQAGNAIDTYIQIRGMDAFLEALRKRGVRPNPKYEQLLLQHMQKKAKNGLESEQHP